MNNTMKVIFHIDEREKWDLTLANVKNILNEAEVQDRPIEVEVLVNAAPVMDLQVGIEESKEIQDTIAELQERGVVIAACKNALSKHDVPEDLLMPDITLVQAGVFELAEKQGEGFAYIRP